MSHARGKAEAAEGVAQKAMEECRLARIAAKELSPSFHIYGNGEFTAGGAAGRSLSCLSMNVLQVLTQGWVDFAVRSQAVAHQCR